MRNAQAYKCQQCSEVLPTVCAELIMEQWTQNSDEEDTEAALRGQLTPGFIDDKRSQILSVIEAKAAELQDGH